MSQAPASLHRGSAGVLGAPTPVRVSLVGTRGRAVDDRLDLAVAPGASLADALRVAAEPVAPERLRLVTLAGVPVPLDVPVADLAIRDGDVLVATTAAEHADRGGAPPAASATSGSPTARTVLLAAGVVAVGSGLVVAAGLPSLAPRALAAGLALLTALAALLTGNDRWGATARALAPLLGAASVAVLVDVPDPRQRALALTAAAVVAAALAAVLRANRYRGEEILLVELVTAVVLALSAGTALLTDLPLPALAALSAGVGVALVRVLPAAAVRVPDETLVDAELVSVTAWSARADDQGGGGTRDTGTDVTSTRDTGTDGDEAERDERAGVRVATVLASVRRARTILDAAVVAAVTVVLGCLPALLVVDDGTVRRIGGNLLAGCVAFGFGLSSRTVRGIVARLALLAGAVGGAVVLVAELLRSHTGNGARGPVVVTIVVLVVLVALLVVVAAVALGRGWQSVYWGRIGDLLETLAVGLALPAGLVAAGAVEFVRQLVS